MIKKIMIVSVVALSVMSCESPSYTDEQAKAAEDFCACMDKDISGTGDYDINFLECEGADVVNDANTQLALKDKCPEQADKITEASE